MKKTRYRFKGPEIQVIKVSEILTQPFHKLPKWVRDSVNKSPTVLWIKTEGVRYWSFAGNCTLPLGPKDYLIRVPLIRELKVYEITGCLGKNFKKLIQVF